jgi:hypothetical protein
MNSMFYQVPLSYKLTMLIPLFRWPKIESQDVHNRDNDKVYGTMSPMEPQITEGKQHSVNAL